MHVQFLSFFLPFLRHAFLDLPEHLECALAECDDGCGLHVRQLQQAPTDFGRHGIIHRNGRERVPTLRQA